MFEDCGIDIHFYCWRGEQKMERVLTEILLLIQFILIVLCVARFYKTVCGNTRTNRWKTESCMFPAGSTAVPLKERRTV